MKKPLPFDAEEETLALKEEEEDSNSLRINEQFAKKFEEKKRKEELSRLKEIGSDQENESESESEDEDGVLDKPEWDQQFLKLLPLISKKDPKIYRKEVNFFSMEAIEDSNERILENVEKPIENSGNSKKTTNRESLSFADRNPALESKIFINGNGKQASSKSEPIKTTIREQDESKRDFLEAVRSVQLGEYDDSVGINQESDDDGDFLQLRKRTEEEAMKEEQEYQQFEEIHKLLEKERSIPKDEVEFLQQYWSAKELDANEKFLKDYILHKGWIEKDKNRIPTYEEIIASEEKDEEDEEFLEKADKFEAKYNFRFEESGGTELHSYPRFITDSVRRDSKADKRKRKRKERKQRKETEKQKFREELNCLKKLKKEEIVSKLKEVQEITGTNVFKEEDLEEDFDPEKHDGKMKQLFNDQFYGQSDKEKPHFDSDLEEIGYEDREDLNVEEKKDRKYISREKVEQNLDEYLKMDYEDLIVNEIPCRFKYIKVPAENFGLTIENILSLPDKELNQTVPMKTLAPYRNESHKKRFKQNDGNGRKHLLSRKPKSFEISNQLPTPNYNRNKFSEERNLNINHKKKKSKKIISGNPH